MADIVRLILWLAALGLLVVVGERVFGQIREGMTKQIGRVT